jgi:hypothetical protein
MARREYKAGRPTTLTGGGLAIGATDFTIASDTNWPTGADYPFWVTIDGGEPNEERILCLSRSGTSVTIVTTPASGRGQDTTTESNHASGASVWPSWSATDADEANAHVNATTGVHGLEVGVAPAPAASPTFTGTVVLPSTTSIGNVNSTELAQLDGISNAQTIQTQLNAKAPTANPTFTGTVSGVTKAMVGLGNVDNTTDAGKPISTATQTALNGKLSTSGGTISGNLVTTGYIFPQGNAIYFGDGNDSITFSDSTNTFTFSHDGGSSNSRVNVGNLSASANVSASAGQISDLISTSITALSNINTPGTLNAAFVNADSAEVNGPIVANEFLTLDSDGSSGDPAFASPQGTSGMYFVGGSTITGIRFTVNGTHRYSITSSGGANASSIRGKDNIETHAVPTEDLLNIRTISYHPKGDERDVTAFGVIAEELNEVPSLRIFLDYEEDGSPISVQYDRIALALINVVKEQQTRIDSLEQRLTALENK